MKAEIIERKDANVLGIMARISPMEADYNAIWRGQFDPRASEVEAQAIEKEYYGVYYGTDQPSLVDFIAGMIVGEVSDVPEGLVSRVIPAGIYAQFECTMATIGSTWGQIYGQWLPQSGYVEDETRPALEIYPPGDMGAGYRLWILIAVNKA